MNTFDGDVPLGDASPLSSPDAHVQGQHVHGPGPSVAGRLSFASVVFGLDRRIDPGGPHTLNIPNGPGERNDAAELNSLSDGTDPFDYSTSPTTDAEGAERPKCCAGAHSFETIDR